jgi:hypothetical protein
MLSPAPAIQGIARQLQLAARAVLGMSRYMSSLPGGTGMSRGRPRRALCVAADIENWSGRPAPEQMRAQHTLVTVIRDACAAARLPRKFAQVNGDGVLIIAPSGIDETRTIPDLIRALQVALDQENRMLSDDARIRLRMAFAEGTIVPGPAGPAGRAVIECFRLLDSPPARHSLGEYPLADLAVIVSDGLYRDVIEQGFRSLQPSRFQCVDCSVPAKGFHAQAWVYVPDR